MKSIIWRKSCNVFIKNLEISFQLKKDVDILDDIGVSKLSAKFFLKVNYSFIVLLNLNRIALTTQEDELKSQEVEFTESK